MTKLKLPLNKIKEFCDLAKSFSVSDLDQIYQYIKIEIDFGKVTITKSTRNSFLIYDFESQDADDFGFIIQEKVLADFSGSTNEPYIYFELDETSNLHKIKDSESKKCYEKVFNDGGYKIKDYPSSHISLNSIEYTRLSKNHLESINRARSFVGKDDLHAMYNHIFISQAPKSNYFYINAFSNQTLYLDKLVDLTNPPFLAISPRENAIITKFDYLEYSSETNFNIYKAGNIIYGFSQTDGAKPVDLSLPLSMFKRDDYFIIKTSDLMKFCTSIKLYSASGSVDKDREDAKWKNSSLVVDFGECTLFFELEKISESIKIVCDVKVIGKEFSFNFNQNLMYEIIKAFNYEELCISDSGNGVCIFSKNHDNMIGFMMKYIKNQNS